MGQLFLFCLLIHMTLATSRGQEYYGAGSNEMYRKLRYFSELLRQADDVGRGHADVLAQFYSLRHGVQRLSVSEYLEYGLAGYSKEDAATFLGYRAEEHYAKLNREHWKLLSNHKVVYANYLHAHDIGQAEIMAFYHPTIRFHHRSPWLRSGKEVFEFLENLDEPVVAKPSNGAYGKHCFCIKGVDRVTRKILLEGSDHIEFDDFQSILRHYQQPQFSGFLFQRLLQPSSATREVFGSRVSTIRMITLLTRDGFKIFRANHKVSLQRNFINNTDKWRNGNMALGIDESTGRSIAARQGRDGTPVPISNHPETGSALTNIPIPHWQGACDLVERLSPIFGGLGFQAWDIALSDQGLIPLELNPVTASTVSTTQLLTGRGFLDQTLQDSVAGVAS